MGWVGIRIVYKMFNVWARNNTGNSTVGDRAPWGSSLGVQPSCIVRIDGSLWGHSQLQETLSVDSMRMALGNGGDINDCMQGRKKRGLKRKR